MHPARVFDKRLIGRAINRPLQRDPLIRHAHGHGSPTKTPATAYRHQTYNILKSGSRSQFSTRGDQRAEMATTKYKLVFRVPVPDMEAVNTAIFAAGAGRYPGPGGYTECAWYTIGTGQFRPGDAANPHIGQVGALEKVEEARVETLCVGEDCARKAVEALKKWVALRYLPYVMSLVESQKTNCCTTELIHMKNPPLKSSRLSNFDSALQLDGLHFTCFNHEPHRQSSRCCLKKKTA